MENDILLPCPWCGSSCVNDTTDPKNIDGIYYWVCPCCVACGPVGGSVEEAANKWNKRLQERVMHKQCYKWNKKD